MIVQEIKATAIFEFKGLPVVMLDSKEIYHTQKQKIISEKLNCRSIGYWIDRRFYTKSKLNKLAVKNKQEIIVNKVVDCPF
jgi:hypothetical protein